MAIAKLEPTGNQSAGARIEFAGVGKRFASGTSEIVALDGIDLEVEPGEAVALMGPSGSGKSTLLHLLGAMDTPTEGALRVDNELLNDLDQAAAARYRARLGFVFQAFHLINGLSVLDNVLLPAVPRGISRALEEKATAILDSVGLGGRANSATRELSGGEQQRVAIARAVMLSPRLLLADEPTGNLDSATGTEVISLLLDLCESAGTTIVLATHDPAVAERLGRLICLRDGRLVA